MLTVSPLVISLANTANTLKCTLTGPWDIYLQFTVGKCIQSETKPFNVVDHQ